MEASLVVGQTKRVTGTFRDANDVLADPTTIALTLTPPGQAASTYTYAGAQLTRQSTGIYYTDVALTRSGLWAATWTGAGALEAVDDFDFYVHPA